MTLFHWHKWRKVDSQHRKLLWDGVFVQYNTLIRYECEKCKLSKVQEIEGAWE